MSQTLRASFIIHPHCVDAKITDLSVLISLEWVTRGVNCTWECKCSKDCNNRSPVRVTWRRAQFRCRNLLRPFEVQTWTNEFVSFLAEYGLKTGGEARESLSGGCGSMRHGELHQPERSRGAYMPNFFRVKWLR